MKNQKSKIKNQNHRFNINSKKIIVTLLLLTSLLYCSIARLLLASKVNAQSLSLSLSPPLLEIMIKPGKTVTQVYTLTNYGESVVMTLTLEELSETGIRYNPQFAGEKWISLESTDIAFNKPFILNSNQSKQITLRVSPSEDVIQKDYYKGLVFSTEPSPAGDSSQSKISQNLVTPLLITVSETGLIAKGAQITSFELPKYIDSFGPLNIDVEIQNTGRTFFHPNGRIFFKGFLGKGSYELMPNIVFANQRKKLFTWDSHENPSELPRHTLTINGFFIGKYEVEVDFALDEGKTRVNQKKIFYALPVKAGMGISVLVIILYLIGKIRYRKTKHA